MTTSSVFATVWDGIGNLFIAVLSEASDQLAAVPTPMKVALAAGATAFVMRGTLFETHAVISYTVRRAIAEARAEREWNWLGSFAQAEFDEVLEERKGWESHEFHRADICEAAAAQAARSSLFPGRAQALRKRARRHMARMQAIQAETQRLCELKERIEAERLRQSVKVSADRVRSLMSGLLSESEALATNALSELNRIAAHVEWDQLVPGRLTGNMRERVLNILRRMGGTDHLGEARAAYGQYQQVLAGR
jgi:hypothetical protein